MEHGLFYYLAFVPLLGIIAQLLAWRLKIPSILLLLLFGVLLGQFVSVDHILAGSAEDADVNRTNFLLFPIVSICVAIILFEGGLSLRFSDLKQAGDAVFRLCTVGVLISWVLTAFSVWMIFHTDIRLAILLGAILVVTGPTVIAPLLRNIRPEKKVAAILKWEGIVVDPIGAVLAVLVLQETLIFTENENPIFIAFSGLLGTLFVGMIIGLVFALVIKWFLKRYWIPDYLHGVATLSLVIASFALSNWLVSESGLVTVTVLGIYLANQKQVAIEHIVEFKEHLGVFIVSCLFIVLGSRLELSDVSNLGLSGLLFVLILVFVVRPASVYLSLLGTKTTLKERTFLSFLAPRGIVAAAVTSAMALELAHHWAHSEGKEELAAQAASLIPITFLVIVATVGFYGLTAGWLARFLGLADANPQGVLIAGGSKWVQQIAKVLNENGITAMMVDTNYRNVTDAKMEGIPAHCSSVLSDKFAKETSFAGIGRLIALTGNDEVNQLACLKYQHHFERSGVFLLPRNPTAEGQRSATSEHVSGRVLFDGEHSSRKFEQLFREGYEVKATKISEEFQYDDFVREYSGNVLLLFLIDANGQMKIVNVEESLSPAPKQTVIALVKPSEMV